jgi:hypothetical protein
LDTIDSVNSICVGSEGKGWAIAYHFDVVAMFIGLTEYRL